PMTILAEGSMRLGGMMLAGKGVRVTSTATRTPFPANIIPPSRIDPSAKIVMGDIWKPNGPGDDITGINNYKITYPWWTNYYNLSNRTDWNVSDKFRMYARYSYFRTRL